jgi:ABC-type nickel/cobalt efflux system permease component RcnA
MPKSNPQSENFVSYRSAESDYVSSVEAYQAQSAQSDNIRLSSQEVAVASVGILLLFAAWYFVRRHLRQRKAHEENLQGHVGRAPHAGRLISHLPCTSCHYFKANMYLPCAVNPTVALKPESENCSDFRPRSNQDSTDAIR